MTGRRFRSFGPLSARQADQLRASGVALVYDPAQIGWLPADIHDDIDDVPPEILTLRRWTPADAPLLRSMLSDPLVWSHLPEGYCGPLSDHDAAALIELANHAPHHEVRAILADGLPVGQVRLVLETGEVSYWLGRAHWGRGLARRALADWTRRCQAAHPLLRLFARIHQDNAASRRVALAAGYVARGADKADPRFDLFTISSDSVPA